MPARTEVSLKNFIIFNSNLGPKEGEVNLCPFPRIVQTNFLISLQEDRKLLFYHPKNVELDSKIKDIGLCEAIIKFTSAFTSKTDVQNVVTQKTLQIYHQPEPDFWMILTLSVPSEKKVKSGQEHTEYRGDEVHESIYKAILKQAYASFKLLNGTFVHNFDGNTKLEQRECLMGVLEEHFSHYLENVCLQSAGILNVFGSVNYLPVNQSHFLRIQAFVNILEATFSEQIADCVFLYNEQVVWSGLAADSLYPFYEYLKEEIFPKVVACGLQSDIMASGFQGSHYGVFVIGPPGSLIEMHPIWFCDKNSSIDEKFTLLIYKAANCMTCLFVREPFPENFYEELSILMGTQMTGISSELNDFQEALAKEKDTHEPTYKYLFVNELTLKHEGTIKFKGNDPKSVPPEVMNLLTDIYQDRANASSEEVTVKTHNDFWLVRKTSNYRHYFLVINKSSSTLIDVTEEAKRITDSHIRSIFFEK